MQAGESGKRLAERKGRSFQTKSVHLGLTQKQFQCRLTKRCTVFRKSGMLRRCTAVQAECPWDLTCHPVRERLIRRLH